MVLYGFALSFDESFAVAALSWYAAGFAEEYLAMCGAALPPGVDVEELVAFYLCLAMDICEPDYEAELRATLSYLRRELLRHWVF